MTTAWLVPNGTDTAPGSGVMPHLTMQGNPVFRWASFAMAKVAHQALERAGITCNKNAIPNDPQRPMVTSGIRLGSPAMTTRLVVVSVSQATRTFQSASSPMCSTNAWCAARSSSLSLGASGLVRGPGCQFVSSVSFDLSGEYAPARAKSGCRPPISSR